MKGADAIAHVVDRLIEKMQAGVDRWEMPWRGELGDGMPTNATTGQPYRGGNVIACWCAALDHGWDRQLWATYKQWATAGAQVRKGEHGLTLVYWDRVTRRDEDDDETFTRLVPRGFSVFNVAQVDGYDVAAAPVATRPDDEIDAWLAPIPYRQVFGSPAYNPAFDVVKMPPPEAFDSLDEYRATLFHELGHWTGHSSRLARTFGKRFGDHEYAAEELVAELSAAFTCHQFGVRPAERADHARYLASWCSMLRAEPTVLWSVASKAQAATDHLNSYAEQHVLVEA